MSKLFLLIKQINSPQMLVGDTAYRDLANIPAHDVYVTSGYELEVLFSVESFRGRQAGRKTA